MARWDRTVPVHPEFHDPDLDYQPRRDAIVGRLHGSGWPARNPVVGSLVDELAAARDEDEFNTTWADIYDEADRDRTWIDTRGPIR